ncbi:MAG: ATP-binding protein [Nonomuraea sp.]|nr:ATP-binding protein [Nonomuraea sp.]NUP64084.1 ATP-binding protein [Nonomuraea sp.]NUP78696.1 ATP-binding protein [Nonomuraea sp.]NUR92908.1 ATP-binding protein [Nonomuraea sp.]NUS04641.1 ATP-binding protein [Nonomuraea sp.]
MGSEAGPYQVDTQLPAEMGSITRARGIARKALAEYGFQGHHEDVLLVVSELVTNALVHGDGPPVLRLSCTRSRVRVEVGDSGSDLPEPREPGPASGWGLHVIKLLCTGWGVSRNGSGKAVWCELTAHLTPLVQERSRA